MQTFKNYRAYMVVGLISIVLAAGALAMLLKLDKFPDYLPPIPSFDQKPELPTPTSTIYEVQPEESAEFSFSIEGGEVQTNLPPLCVDLSANPLSGSAPLTVRFIGSGQDQDERVAFFEFDFGDGKKQIVEKEDSRNQQLTIQEISHTYTKAGTYQAGLKVIDNNDVESTVPDICTVEINASGGAIGAPEQQVTIQPTKTPTATPTATPQPKPVSPTTALTSVPVPPLPEAGGLLPTIVGVSAAAAVIVLAILL